MIDVVAGAHLEELGVVELQPVVLEEVMANVKKFEFWKSGNLLIVAFVVLTVAIFGYFSWPLFCDRFGYEPVYKACVEKGRIKPTEFSWSNGTATRTVPGFTVVLADNEPIIKGPFDPNNRDCIKIMADTFQSCVPNIPEVKEGKWEVVKSGQWYCCSIGHSPVFRFADK